MLSHVAAGGEDHFDWFTVHVDAAGTTREVRLLDARNRSAPVRVRLAPSDQVHHRVDLCAWALRPRNGARALGLGRPRRPRRLRRGRRSAGVDGSPRGRPRDDQPLTSRTSTRSTRHPRRVGRPPTVRVALRHAEGGSVLRLNSTGSDPHERPRRPLHVAASRTRRRPRRRHRRDRGGAACGLSLQRRRRRAGEYARATFDPETGEMLVERLRDLHAGDLPRPGIDVVDGPNGREIAVIDWDTPARRGARDVPARPGPLRARRGRCRQGGPAARRPRLRAARRCTHATTGASARWSKASSASASELASSSASPMPTRCCRSASVPAGRCRTPAS